MTHAPGQDPSSTDSAPDQDPQLARGDAALAAGNFAEAIESYRRACQAAPRDTRPLVGLYTASIASGELALARQSVDSCLALDPENYDALLTLSALLWKGGAREEAWQVLGQAAHSHPIVTKRDFDPGKPAIVRFRSLERSHYNVIKRRDGTYRKLLSGGHFSTRFLLERGHYNSFVVNVHGRNLDRLNLETPADLFINSVSCPDLGANALASISRFVKRWPGVPVINHPDRVMATSRDRNCQRLGAIPGVVFAKTVRFRSSSVNADLLASLLAAKGFGRPLILRKAGTQTGQSIALISEHQGIVDYLEQAAEDSEHYAIQYIDSRGESGLYHKTRVFFIDGRLYPVAALTSDSWQIHSGDRYRVMTSQAWTRQREQKFLEHPEDFLGADNLRRLYAIRDLLELDFFGVDFTILQDGRMLVFEANPAMRHNFDHVPSFPYTEPYLTAVSEAFNRMVEARLSKRA